MKTGIITTDTYLDHDTGQGHPERADRVTVVIDHLKKVKSKNLIWKKYIKPMDAEHTKRMIEITKKYGFPRVKRIKKFYNKDFIDPEFNPLIIFIHSPKKYWKELKILMLKEYKNGNINQCQYGYTLWQFTGRKNFQPMLDNGFEMVEENGKTTIKSTCD